MRKNFLFRSLTLAFLVGLGVSATKIQGAPCGTTVSWHNLSDTGCGPGQSNPGITTDVVDQNIDIIGTNALAGGIHVQALTCDITISVTNGDAIITGSGNLCNGAIPPAPALYLYAAFGHTINFNLVDSLLFSGTANGATKVDLLVTASGNGIITFTLGEGQTVSFSPKDLGSGGTFFIAGMSTAAPALVIFQNSIVGSLPADVVVGPRSFMGFAAQIGDVDASGTIEFNAGANLGTIRLQLIIEDGGGFSITGYPADLTLPDFMISDIDFATSAGVGTNATVLLSNAAGPGFGAAMQIINNNTAGCDTLLINSFCQTPATMPPSGFVLTGPNTLTVPDQSYIEYIGTATNVCCTFTLADECGNPMTVQRLRNGSAFIIDAPNDATPATINLLGSSAIYFLSGVSNCDTVAVDFTVNTSILATCAGNIVLDVEGPLNVFGSSANETGLQILSLQVDPVGCPVTVDSTSPFVNFPSRTFARQPDGNYIQYNLAAFLINNRMSLFSTSLIHTDTIHKVFEHFNLGNPNLFSEPTYVGGDSFTFPCHGGRGRPTISFTNSDFRVHSSVASTGVDFLFPNNPDGDNISNIIFYNNGFCIDKGYGRNMILGTDICFTNCDTTTGLDSHLNVFQEDAQAVPTNLIVNLLTSYNTDCITQGITSTASIANQNAVQTIYLNNASNFSIGTNGAVGVTNAGTTFDLTVTANVFINGSTFSFETRGGTLAYPASSGTTGEGGIFVDALGVFSLLNNRIASFGTMVTKSRSGVVLLPSNQVFFEPRIGIAEWQPDLSDPTQSLIIGPDDQLSDYTFDWGAAKKAFCCDDLITSTTCFIPYFIEEVPSPCAAPAVIQNNLVDLPTVQGEVDQLQILRSRIGDFIHLNVDGGFIRELVFLHGYNTAEAPTGFIVIQNDGVVGLGSAHKDVDSLEASIVLGVNGVMLVPNGNANIELNEDVIINNVCHILSGTAFGLNGPNTLAISSTTPKELRIKSTGVLDLSQLTTPNQIFEITGQVKLVCEPGARIIMGGGTFVTSGQSIIYLEPEFDTQVAALPAVNVQSTDPVRVKLSGSGTINMIEFSSMFIPQNAFFGVETFVTCSTITDLLWILNDQSSIQIGNNGLPGGSFQVGDTSSSVEPRRSISLQLELSGQGALFEINRQGFFGLSCGIVQKLANQNPNMWSVSCLNNVETCSIIIGGPLGVGTTPGGTFSHNQIDPGNFEEASLFAIGSQGNYTFLFNEGNSVILGGGNLVKINCTQLDDTIIPTSINPTVTTFAGVQPGGFVQSGVMAGKFLLLDGSKPQTQAPGVTAQGLFNYLSTLDNGLQFASKANISSNALNALDLAFVVGSTIRRDPVSFILGSSGNNVVGAQHSLQIGAVSILIDPVSLAIISLFEILGDLNF